MASSITLNQKTSLINSNPVDKGFEYYYKLSERVTKVALKVLPVCLPLYESQLKITKSVTDAIFKIKDIWCEGFKKEDLIILPLFTIDLVATIFLESLKKSIKTITGVFKSCYDLCYSKDMLVMVLIKSLESFLEAFVYFGFLELTVEISIALILIGLVSSMLSAYSEYSKEKYLECGAESFLLGAKVFEVVSDKLL